MRKIKKAQGGESLRKDSLGYVSTRRVKRPEGTRYYQASSPDMAFARELSQIKSRTRPADSIPKAKIHKESMESMNKKNGGTIKKAQNGTPSAYMQKRAAQDKVKAANIRARDSVLNRQAAARGMTREEQQKFLAKNAKKSDQQLEGTYTASDAKAAEKKEGKSILRTAIQAVTGAPGCIYSGENKSGCKSGESAGHKNGGTIKKVTVKKAQFGAGLRKVMHAAAAPAKKAGVSVEKQYAKKGLGMAIERRVNPTAAKKKMTKAQRQSFEVDDSYRKNGGRINSKKK